MYQEKPANELINKIELLRGSRVITYVTSDQQPPLAARMALDTMPIFYNHIKKIEKTKRIDLFIYSTGGDIVLPWRLVNLIREYCQQFSVLIPYKAHSAATMLALGADSIVMGPLGELSPIDPSIETPFNPPHSDVPNEPKIPIGVEDVFSYINLAKEKMSITDQNNLVQILDKLIEKIHPLAIGAVYRSHSLIRLLATRLLQLHMRKKNDIYLIQQIVNDLVEKLFYHGYLISRNEAKNLGLKIVYPSLELEEAMWGLYQHYSNSMGIGKAFDPISILPDDKESIELEVSIAEICSAGLQSNFKKWLKITRISSGIGMPPQIQMMEKNMGWVNF